MKLMQAGFYFILCALALGSYAIYVIYIYSLPQAKSNQRFPIEWL